MHAQQLPHAAHAPPIPMMPHPGLPGPPSTAASLLGLSGALGPGAHPLSMLGTKPDLHRDDVKSSSGNFTYNHFNNSYPSLPIRLSARGIDLMFSVNDIMFVKQLHLLAE
jgi:hypothetical protein